MAKIPNKMLFGVVAACAACLTLGLTLAAQPPQKPKSVTVREVRIDWVREDHAFPSDEFDVY